MINFALFGAGRIGSIHGANVAANKQALLVGVCDPYQPNADKLIAELGCAQMTEQEIFTDDSIAAILICSATDTHADLIEQAVAAGKHVFWPHWQWPGLPALLSLQASWPCRMPRFWPV